MVTFLFTINMIHFKTYKVSCSHLYFFYDNKNDIYKVFYTFSNTCLSYKYYYDHNKHRQIDNDTLNISEYLSENIPIEIIDNFPNFNEIFSEHNKIYKRLHKLNNFL